MLQKGLDDEQGGSVATPAALAVLEYLLYGQDQVQALLTSAALLPFAGHHPAVLICLSRIRALQAGRCSNSGMESRLILLHDHLQTLSVAVRSLVLAVQSMHSATAWPVLKQFGATRVEGQGPSHSSTVPKIQLHASCNPASCWEGQPQQHYMLSTGAGL